MKTFIRITLPVMLAVLLGPTVTAFSQGSEEEPNNTCQDAQDLGSVELPFFVDGSLDTPPEVPDIDFFRFTGTPGSGVRADLEGADTGMGTLPDPLLGLFDSSCNLISFNDDSFENLNSRLIFVVPPDGVFILAATGFADFGFSGDGFVSGSYRLTAAAQPLDGTIQGRVVDALPGHRSPERAPPSRSSSSIAARMRAASSSSTFRSRTMRGVSSSSSISPTSPSRRGPIRSWLTPSSISAARPGSSPSPPGSTWTSGTCRCCRSRSR